VSSISFTDVVTKRKMSAPTGIRIPVVSRLITLLTEPRRFSLLCKEITLVSVCFLAGACPVITYG
jgi:hypothetical protein